MAIIASSNPFPDLQLLETGIDPLGVGNSLRAQYIEVFATDAVTFPDSIHRAHFELFGLPPVQALAVTRSGAGTGTVTSSPAGIACGATCAASFTTDSRVTLMAAPDSGSIFTAGPGTARGQERAR